MRKAYIVSYDIADDKRLRRVFQTLLGYGDHIQLSVFRCELGERDRIILASKLSALIHQDEDQVLFIDIGPVSGRARKAVKALGMRYAPRARACVVV